MIATDTRIEIANKIAAALNGAKTTTSSRGNCWMLTAKVWAKGDKVRIYSDARFVNADGALDRRTDGNGYIDVTADGQLVNCLRMETNEIMEMAHKAL